MNALGLERFSTFARARVNRILLSHIMLSLSARLAYARPATLRTTRAMRLYSHKTTILPANCPSCGTPLPTRLPACPKCRFIQRIPDDYDYYDLLRTEKSENPFQLDKAKLRRSFLDVQRYIHPDVWSPHGEVCQSTKSEICANVYQDKVNVARDLSGVVNKAYSTLLWPLSRAQYILRDHGLDVSETDQVEDPELLMEILESREALEDAKDQRDVDGIRAQNAGQYRPVILSSPSSHGMYRSHYRSGQRDKRTHRFSKLGSGTQSGGEVEIS